MHQQLNLTPRLFQTPGVILNRFGNNINGSILVGIVSIWVTRGIAKKCSHMFQPDLNIQQPPTTGIPRTPAKTIHKGSPHLSRRDDLEMLQELATKERQDGFGISQGKKNKVTKLMPMEMANQNRTTLRECFNMNQSQCVVFPLRDARTQDGENTQIEDY